MPAIAHVGVGFAAKRIAPDISVIYLIIAAELIEIVFFVFVAAGVETMPLPDKSPFTPYSHSVIKLLLVFIPFLLFLNLASGQKVFSVEYPNQADVKVFVVKYENQAELKVFKVKYENQAGWREKKKIHLMF